MGFDLAGLGSIINTIVGIPAQGISAFAGLDALMRSEDARRDENLAEIQNVLMQIFADEASGQGRYSGLQNTLTGAIPQLMGQGTSAANTALGNINSIQGMQRPGLGAYQLGGAAAMPQFNVQAAAPLAPINTSQLGQGRPPMTINTGNPSGTFNFTQRQPETRSFGERLGQTFPAVAGIGNGIGEGIGGFFNNWLTNLTRPPVSSGAPIQPGGAPGRNLNPGSGGSMPSYAVGTNYVPQTGPAMLHQGEAVVPANQNPTNPANQLTNPPTRTFGQGGATDPSMHLNLQNAAQQYSQGNANAFNQLGNPNQVVAFGQGGASGGAGGARGNVYETGQNTGQVQQPVFGSPEWQAQQHNGGNQTNAGTTGNTGGTANNTANATVTGGGQSSLPPIAPPPGYAPYNPYQSTQGPYNPYQSYGGPNQYLNSGLANLQGMANSGGPINPEVQRIQEMQLRDSAQQQLQNVLRGQNESLGARGMGQSAVQDYMNLMAQMGTNNQITSGVNQIGLDAATQNFDALAGVNRSLTEGGVGLENALFNWANLGEQSRQFGAGYGQRERELEELSRQFGANYGLNRDQFGLDTDRFLQDLFNSDRDYARQTAMDQYGINQDYASNQLDMINSLAPILQLQGAEQDQALQNWLAAWNSMFPGQSTNVNVTQQ